MKVFLCRGPEFSRNSELGIDLRSIFGTGVGKNLVQKQSVDLLLSVGAQFNREQPIGGDTVSAQNSAEGLVAIQFKKFRYKDPELNINTSFSLFPSLTEQGRIRSALNLKFSFEFLGDFNFNVSFWHNFDNDPPTDTATRNDWGVSSGLGYSL